MQLESREYKDHLIQLPYFRVELLLQNLCLLAIKNNWAPAVIGSQVRLSGKADGQKVVILNWNCVPVVSSLEFQFSQPKDRHNKSNSSVPWLTFMYLRTVLIFVQSSALQEKEPRLLKPFIIRYGFQFPIHSAALVCVYIYPKVLCPKQA